MLGAINLVELLVVRQHVGPIYIIVCNLLACISVGIYNHNLMSGQYLDLGSGPLPVVIILQGGQEVTPLFVGKGKNPIFALHLILHGCRNNILNCDVYIIFSEIVITDSPIGLIIYVSLI